MFNEKLIAEAREKHPEAENDIVALDLLAQDIYNGAVDASASEAEYNALASKYHALVGLRADILNAAIENESEIIREASNVEG